MLNTIRVRFHTLNTGAVLVALMFTGISEAQAVPLNVVTPGEQNTQSPENGCAKTPCAAGHWLHYPELLGVALGAGYTVHNNGDAEGAVLGCDAATTAAVGNSSFCKHIPYTSSINPAPDIVIIGPFGEHDQRIVTASAANMTNLYMESVFEGAYEGLVQKYLPLTSKIFIMTPIDVPWGGTPNLPAGKNIVKDMLLPAAKKVAQNHGLTIIDTYTAISATPQLVTMYYATDGQVNAAAQQKMTDLILAALKDAGSGADGGTSDAGDAAAPKDAPDDAGSGGAPGTGGAAGTGGAIGSGGTSGTGGASGTGGSISAGTGGTSGGSGGSPAVSGTQSSGGCSVGNGAGVANTWPLLIALASIAVALGRRRTRRSVDHRA